MSSGGGGVLKLVNKYLVQAKKLDEVEPVIAYYCRLHAAQVALKQRKSKQDDAVAGELISWCEKVTHNNQHTHHTSLNPPTLAMPSPHPLPFFPLSLSLSLSPPPQHKKAIEGLSKDEARARVETFALDVFATADVEDRQGPITNRTATAFFAAFIFMDVCHQFGDLALDIEQKMKYSAWKATEINRALKEGRTPKPGGVDEEGGGFGGMEDVRGGRGGAAEDQGTAPGGGGFGGASRSGGAGGGGGGGGGVGGFVAGGGSGGFVPDGDGGIAGPRGGSGGGGAGGGKSVSWQQHEDDERMAARYAASLPSAPSAPPSSSEAMDDEKDTSSAPPSSFHPSVFPIHPPSSSSLPSSYLPSSPLPPPLPPQPSSHETAHAFGFTVDGASTSSPTSYTPGFTGPSVPPRPSLPSPSSSPAPSAPSKFPASSAPSPPPSSSRYSPAPASSGGPPALPPVLGKSRVVAVKEADRLMKHAASALSFDDIDTSIAKLQQAVALLYPHKTP